MFTGTRPPTPVTASYVAASLTLRESLPPKQAGPGAWTLHESHRARGSCHRLRDRRRCRHRLNSRWGRRLPSHPSIRLSLLGFSCRNSNGRRADHQYSHKKQCRYSHYVPPSASRALRYRLGTRQMRTSPSHGRRLGLLTIIRPIIYIVKDL